MLKTQSWRNFDFTLCGRNTIFKLWLNVDTYWRTNWNHESDNEFVPRKTLKFKKHIFVWSYRLVPALFFGAHRQSFSTYFSCPRCASMSCIIKCCNELIWIWQEKQFILPYKKSSRFDIYKYKCFKLFVSMWIFFALVRFCVICFFFWFGSVSNILKISQKPD